MKVSRWFDATPEQRAKWQASSSAWRLRNKEKVNETRRAWQKKNCKRLSAEALKFKRKKKYGISHDEFVTLVAQQAGQCAICHEDLQLDKSRGANVDHDHVTGNVRGVLCSRCNTGLGLFKDDMTRLFSAVDYLIQSTQVDNG